MTDTTSSWSGRRISVPAHVRRRVLATADGCALAYPVCTNTPGEVDHKVGVADALAAGWNPEDVDDETNLQAVCSPCHKLKTAAEQARGRARRADRTRRDTTLDTDDHPGLIR